MQTMENLNILNLKLFFLIKTPLKKARQCVYYFICFTLTMIGLKMVTRELFSPTDWAKAQTLYIYKLSEFIIVSKKKNLVFATF